MNPCSSLFCSCEGMLAMASCVGGPAAAPMIT